MYIGRCETETLENGFLGLHFTASKVRTLRHVAHAKILICLTRKLKLTTDGQIFAFLTYFEKYAWPFVSKLRHGNAGFSAAYNGLHTLRMGFKVQLTPNFFLPLMKTTSFLYYFSEKIISIDIIPPILQAFKVVLSCPTTEHGGLF